MKHVMIMNPAAGKYDVTGQCQKEFSRAMSGLDFECHVTEYPRHGENLVKSICEQISDKEITFYACGGDGTLNEVVCGAIGYQNAIVTHYPCGSGNDFIKTFNIPKEKFLDIPSLLNGKIKIIDTIKGSHFSSINICTVGLDARIAGATANIKQWPLITGNIAYNLSVLINIIKGLGEEFTVTADGQHYDGKYSMIVAANANYYGGTFHPVPDAKPDDGILDILLVKAISRTKAASLIKMYSEGRYKELPDVFTKFTASEIHIESNKKTAVNYDGEIIYDHAVSFKIAEEKIRFLIPG